MKKIRVLIADDHAVVRAGLTSILRFAKDIQVVGSVANGRDAVVKTGELHPNVVIMDLMMPVMNGVDASARIAELHPESKILILTTYGSSEDIRRALDAGAVGAFHPPPAANPPIRRSVRLPRPTCPTRPIVGAKGPPSVAIQNNSSPPADIMHNVVARRPFHPTPSRHFAKCLETRSPQTQPSSPLRPLVLSADISCPRNRRNCRARNRETPPHHRYSTITVRPPIPPVHIFTHRVVANALRHDNYTKVPLANGLTYAAELL